MLVSPGTVRVVGGEGFIRGKGDLYIRFNITFPRRLEEGVREELRALLA